MIIQTASGEAVFAQTYGEPYGPGEMTGDAGADGYGNRIEPLPVYMTDYGPVEITDIDPRSYKMLEMTALNGDMPVLSIYSVFTRHLAAHAEAAQVNGEKPAPVSFSEWKRSSAAAASILGHGRRQHEKATRVLSWLSS